MRCIWNFLFGIQLNPLYCWDYTDNRNAATHIFFVRSFWLSNCECLLMWLRSPVDQRKYDVFLKKFGLPRFNCKTQHHFTRLTFCHGDNFLYKTRSANITVGLNPMTKIASPAQNISSKTMKFLSETNCKSVLGIVNAKSIVKVVDCWSRIDWWRLLQIKYKRRNYNRIVVQFSEITNVFSTILPPPIFIFRRIDRHW